ncbi:hypothetical protein N7468_000589 [Penicillium chermesinum]|uniref:Uncharacterized protein n=1 Tax=Penicillium chermesinum TaxID=63820 RepID=A0A9W9TYH5_9EURO|nr:uncharacterized protein N7468_000589 [Penicillium chermesinum]KAJ5249138.1 hypothetical protein N7468_000589 [Penicillium chermesinum]
MCEGHGLHGDAPCDDDLADPRLAGCLDEAVCALGVGTERRCLAPTCCTRSRPHRCRRPREAGDPPEGLAPRAR